jgi:2-deoxy-D-gluconate 3-dehydrogenase
MPNVTIVQLFDLTDKGAIVTGGAMGIGQGIAFRLAEAGAGIMIADIDTGAAGETVQQIADRGGRAQAICADVTSPDDATAAVRACVDAFGSLDILVNNAGVYPHSPALEISDEMWDRVLGVNLKGVYFFSQAAAEEMIRAGHGGKIVNIASDSGLHPGEDRAAYCTSKAAVIMLTQAMALELARHSILVNVVAPGGVMTPGGAALAAQLKARGVSMEEMADNFMARVPLHRLGEPDDIARVVLFLASAAADYMTGSVVSADGGRLLS